jgi:hypothetical protein
MQVLRVALASIERMGQIDGTNQMPRYAVFWNAARNCCRWEERSGVVEKDVSSLLRRWHGGRHCVESNHYCGNLRPVFEASGPAKILRY